ncbi:hypothetical protein D9M70_543360 [compost metagenome]
MAKTRLQFSAQASAIHITPREQASRRRWPGRTNLSRAMASMGPIRISVLSNSSRVVAIPVSSARMACWLLVRSMRVMIRSRHRGDERSSRGGACMPGTGWIMLSRR